MKNTLLILPIFFKNSIPKEIQQIIAKAAPKHEVFYVESSSLDNLKKYAAENVFDVVVYVCPSVNKDLKYIRCIKSLNLESKIVIISPELPNLNNLQNIKADIYDSVYQWIKAGSDLELSMCQISDAVVVSADSEKDLLSKELKDISVFSFADILSKGLNFAERPKYTVSIVMLTYNQLEDTKISVESLFKHTQGVNYELIFVDNGSTKDKTKEYLESLKAAHSNIKTIYNDENLGFACANNQGIEISEGEYVLLLNNDVILTDKWLERMLMVAESDKKTGVVGPCTNHASGRQVVIYDGTEEDDAGIQEFAKSVLAKNAGCRISVSRIIGFCVLIKREVLFKVGVLDEMFGPGGYEDYDFCMRVKQAGYDIAVAADTFIYHIGGKGYTSNNMNYTELRGKNIELLIDKWIRSNLEIMEKLPDGM